MDYKLSFDAKNTDGGTRVIIVTTITVQLQTITISVQVWKKQRQTDILLRKKRGGKANKISSKLINSMNM